MPRTARECIRETSRNSIVESRGISGFRERESTMRREYGNNRHHPIIACPAFSSSIRIFLHTPQQPDLTCVINIVRRSPTNQMQWVRRGYFQSCDRIAQARVFRFKNRDVSFPVSLLRISNRPRKEIAALQHKRAALRSGQLPANHILPVSRVQSQFPDVMPPRLRPPRGLICRYSPNRIAQVRSVPGLLVERLVEIVEKHAKLRLQSNQASLSYIKKVRLRARPMNTPTIPNPTDPAV